MPAKEAEGCKATAEMIEEAETTSKALAAREIYYGSKEYTTYEKMQAGSQELKFDKCVT